MSSSEVVRGVHGSLCGSNWLWNAIAIGIVAAALFAVFEIVFFGKWHDIGGALATAALFGVIVAIAAAIICWAISWMYGNSTVTERRTLIQRDISAAGRRYGSYGSYAGRSYGSYDY